jgi:UDP-glucose:(heptosyl)LPS alpha-1,3-glucosyltransferase
MEGGENLKIAVLVKSFILSGGSERYAVEVTRRLKARGHEIHIYSRLVNESVLDGIHHIKVPNRHTYSSAANSLSFAREAAQLLKGKRYDIIHSHERGYRQDVLTVHTFSYRSGLDKYSFLHRMDQTYLSLRSGIYLWLEKRQMTSPRLVAVSNLIREDIKKYYRRTEGVRVITPGVDLNWFHPDRIADYRETLKVQSGVASNDLAVLFVGGEFRRKGLDRLIPSIGANMRLIVVGRGERPEHYRMLAADCGVSERVQFIGHVDGDMRKYYALADVVALPSSSEAFGMSILEAMSCGLPVVVSPSAGVACLIEEGKNGFMAGDVRELHSAFIRLQDITLRKEMGRRARLAAEDCSWDRIAADYEEVFLDVVNSRRGMDCHS